MWAGGNYYLLMFLMKVCLVTTAKILQSKILPWPINLLLVIQGEKKLHCSPVVDIPF